MITRRGWGASLFLAVSNMHGQHDSILTLPIPTGVMLSRSEASRRPSSQTFRGVYTSEANVLKVTL